MKYKTVLIGEHKSLKEDLFLNVEQLDCMTSSLFVADIEKHIKYFKPDLLVVCLNDDTKELISTIAQVRDEIRKNEVVLVVIGDKDEVEAYEENAVYPGDVYVARPLTNKKIMASIDDYIEQREKEREEARRLEEERLAAERKPHILVVDDDSNMLTMLKSQLEKKYKVATAVNGGLALRFLAKKTTDLILLDYEMPVQSGPQVLSILRKNESTKDIPIIFLTGVQDMRKIAKVLELNPQGYLLKPVSQEKLMSTVEEVLEAAKEQDTDAEEE